MRLFILIFCLILPVATVARPLMLQDIRVWAAPDSTRVVFDVSDLVRYKLLRLDDPIRLVIDINNTGLSTAAKQKFKGLFSHSKLVKNIRYGRRGKSDLRLVLDLNKELGLKGFLLPPNNKYGHRLVIDLYDNDEQHDVTAAPVNKDNKRSEDVIIAIDAGHGGEDPGAVGVAGLKEKDVTLRVAKKLAYLIDQQKGMKAVLIRKGDYYLGLRQRIAKARQHKADMFISIHADAFRDRRVQGSSVYILSNSGASSEAARWLAERENASDLIGGISLDDKDNMLASVLLDLSQTASREASINVANKVLSSLKKIGKTHKKHVQSAGFAVLKSPDIPSILVETAYISNPEEEKKLNSARYRDNLARALLDGLRDYFMETPPAGTWFARVANRKHTIVRGDTLSEIAERYSVSMQSLRRSNRLKGDLIRTGQVLKIPAT